MLKDNLTPDKPYKYEDSILGTFFETASEAVCAKTGMTIRYSPEWTDIILTPEYFVTFHLIDKNILNTYPRLVCAYHRFKGFAAKI